MSLQWLAYQLPSRQKSINLFLRIQQITASHNFIKSTDRQYRELHCQKYVLNYSWVCFYTWLLLHKFRQSQPGLSKQTILLPYNLKVCLEEFTRQYTYNFDDTFNIEAYEELKRKQGTILWSLNDLFDFDFKKKSLEQIVYEDFGYHILEQQFGETDRQLFDNIINNSIKHIQQQKNNIELREYQDIIEGKQFWKVIG